MVRKAMKIKKQLKSKTSYKTLFTFSKPVTPTFKFTTLKRDDTTMIAFKEVPKGKGESKDKGKVEVAPSRAGDV